MALYSVWDWDHNAWAVYRDSRPVSVGDDPVPPRPTDVNFLGADPDTQCNPLPPSARFVGYDTMCRGEVRRRVAGSGLGLDLPAAADMQKYLIGAAIGVGLYWLWSQR